MKGLVKCCFTWGKPWKIKGFEICNHGTGQEQLAVQVDVFVGETERERASKRVYLRIVNGVAGAKSCPRRWLLHFVLNFLTESHPRAGEYWMVIRAGWISASPHPHPFHYCELIRLYLSNFCSWQNVNLSWDFSLLFCLWPVALGLACCNNLNLSPEAPIIVTLLACKLFN